MTAYGSVQTPEPPIIAAQPVAPTAYRSWPSARTRERKAPPSPKGRKAWPGLAPVCASRSFRCRRSLDRLAYHQA